MAVKYASNNIDNFEEGGLYPGGSGVIEDIKYVLWDYDRNQPKDSVIAVYVKFQPTDGSNEGKPVPIHWAAGNDVKSFAPDPTGGHLVVIGAREKQSTSSNWAYILKKFRDNCGMDVTKLDGADGILALLRTEVTFARMDQPKREGLDDDNKPASEGEKKSGNFKRTVLVPTKARFPWEKGAGKSAAAKTTAAAPAPAASATSTAPAASSSNGSGEDADLSMLIKDIATNAGGVIEFAAIPKALMEKLADFPRDKRTAIVKDSKDLAKVTALAEENGWTFDGKELIV